MKKTFPLLKHEPFSTSSLELFDGKAESKEELAASMTTGNQIFFPPIIYSIAFLPLPLSPPFIKKGYQENGIKEFFSSIYHKNPFFFLFWLRNNLFMFLM